MVSPGVEERGSGPSIGCTPTATAGSPTFPPPLPPRSLWPALAAVLFLASYFLLPLAYVHGVWLV